MDHGRLTSDEERGFALGYDDAEDAGVCFSFGRNSSASGSSDSRSPDILESTTVTTTTVARSSIGPSPCEYFTSTLVIEPVAKTALGASGIFVDSMVVSEKREEFSRINTKAACVDGHDVREAGDISAFSYVDKVAKMVQQRQDELNAAKSGGDGAPPALDTQISIDPATNNISNNVRCLLGDDENSQVVLRNGIQKTELDNNIVLNEYVLPKNSTLGAGVTSQVKLAFSLESRAKFAVKIIKKTKLLANKIMRRRGNEFSDSAFREIAVLRKLDHPNIVKLLEVLDNPEEDNLYLVFELLPKGPVINIPTRIPLSIDLAWKYFRDIVAGVEYLHENHIIHRDLKPENMLVDENDTVKISDFGTSIEWHYNDQISNPFATPAFTAPECLSEESYLTSGTAMDVWSLGISLYAMLTGNVPWTAVSYGELINQVQNYQLQYPSHFPRDLVNLFHRLLDRDPVVRIDSWDIRKDAWVTKRGAAPWKVKRGNSGCATTVTDEDVARSVKNISRSESILLLQRAVNKYTPSLSAIDLTALGSSEAEEFAATDRNGFDAAGRRGSTSSNTSSGSSYRRNVSMPVHPRPASDAAVKLANDADEFGCSSDDFKVMDPSNGGTMLFDDTGFRSESMETKVSDDASSTPSTPRVLNAENGDSSGYITWATAMKATSPCSSSRTPFDRGNYAAGPVNGNSERQL